MYNFQHYYDLRQAGYDPNEVGSGYLRSIRSALKGYIKRIEGSKGNIGSWGQLKSTIQEIYNTLAGQNDLNTLSQEIQSHISELTQMQVEDRMQQGIKLSIIRMLNELRNHLSGEPD